MLSTIKCSIPHTEPIKSLYELLRVDHGKALVLFLIREQIAGAVRHEQRESASTHQIA